MEEIENKFPRKDEGAGEKKEILKEEKGVCIWDKYIKKTQEVQRS